jgi:flap endonuclease-1
MDTLTFNSPRMLKHLTFSEQRKLPVDIIDLGEVLEGLGLSMDQFIEVCMLSGCDYLEPLKKVAAKTALKLIRDYGDMGSVLEHLAKGKNPPPEDWPWREAKELFVKPDVQPANEVEVRDWGQRAPKVA